MDRNGCSIGTHILSYKPKPKSTESIILFKKKAPKGAFAIFISDNQSGVSRFEPGRSGTAGEA